MWCLCMVFTRMLVLGGQHLLPVQSNRKYKHNVVLLFFSSNKCVLSPLECRRDRMLFVDNKLNTIIAKVFTIDTVVFNLTTHDPTRYIGRRDNPISNVIIIENFASDKSFVGSIRWAPSVQTGPLHQRFLNHSSDRSFTGMKNAREPLNTNKNR